MFSKGKKDGPRKSRRKGKAPPTIISADLTVTGNLTSDGDVLIDGTVDGDVISTQLSVSQNGRVVGSVRRRARGSGRARRSDPCAGSNADRYRTGHGRYLS